MKITKTIYFDMDGTIANTYAQENWLERLRNSDVSVYEQAAPLVDMNKLQAVIKKLKDKGYDFGVITWLSKTGTPEFNIQTSQAKIEWIKKYLPDIKNIHCVKYGTPKHQVSKGYFDIIIDDDETVLKQWKIFKKSKPIDAKTDFIKTLEALI